jgi:hypothetical protein
MNTPHQIFARLKITKVYYFAIIIYNSKLIIALDHGGIDDLHNEQQVSNSASDTQSMAAAVTVNGSVGTDGINSNDNNCGNETQGLWLHSWHLCYSLIILRINKVENSDNDGTKTESM